MPDMHASMYHEASLNLMRPLWKQVGATIEVYDYLSTVKVNAHESDIYNKKNCTYMVHRTDWWPMCNNIHTSR